LRFYECVNAGLPVLAPFVGIPAICIDTTTKTTATVLRQARAFVTRTLFDKPETSERRAET
jgi:hypothetical protein